MALKDFKILMGMDETKNPSRYIIYDSNTRNLISYSEEALTSIINSGQSIRCLDPSKRTEGTWAVLYRVEAQRYIVLNPFGWHMFRTFNEICNNIDKFFNVEICEDTLRSLDGIIQHATEYLKNITYADMYRYNLALKIHVDKDTGVASVVGTDIDNISSITLPNFISRIASHSFEDKNIKSFHYSSNIKAIADYAFHGSHIGLVELSCKKNILSKHSFDGAHIDTLEINNSSNILSGNPFTGASIGIMDLETSRMKLLNYDSLGSIARLEHIILPVSIKTIDLDKLPKSLIDITFTAKDIKLVSKSNSKVDKAYKRLDLEKGRRKVLNLVDL